MTKQQKKQVQPPQHQNKQPGLEHVMNPVPVSDDKNYRGSQKLQGKTAIITGGDSGIGKAVAIAFAKEGANIVIGYLDEHEDAETTKKAVESYGTKEQNGFSFLGNTLYIEDASSPSYEICTGPRINIDYAEEAIHFPWRFYLKDHPCVSR